MHKTIDASKNVLESYTRLFVAGKRQWLDLVNSSRELTQNKMALADLKASYVTSAYRLALKNGDIKLDAGEIK
jgi:adhesin transport system outer membrane protein